MSSRKGKKKRSNSPEKDRSENERKPKQSSGKGQNPKRKVKPAQSSNSYDRPDDEGIRQNTSRGLGDSRLGRTYPSKDALHEGGRKKPGKATGSREACAQNTSKKTTVDPFAYLRKKSDFVGSPKHKMNVKMPSKSKFGKKDSSDSDGNGEGGGSTDSGSSGDSESSGSSEKSEDSESTGDSDSKSDDSGNSVRSQKSKNGSSGTEGASGTWSGKRTHENNAGKSDRRDRSKNTTEKVASELPRQLSRFSLTPEKYEWQFFDERWITYGQANFAGAQPSETEYNSDDIEAFYCSRSPKQKYMRIQNKYHMYKLDFEKMIQTNQSTSAERQIRRITKRAANASSLELCDYNGPGSFNMHHGFGSDARGDNPHNDGNGHTTLAWQFKDESGTWITYGQSSPAGGQSSGTTTSSDDIEKFRLKNPGDMMVIQSSLHQYVLDFQKMTQTNIKTAAHREIRCVPFITSNANFSSGASGLAIGGLNSGRAFGKIFVWQFEDDNGAWITYGRSSSAHKTPFATTVTSDDIEQFYNVKRGLEPMVISNPHSQYVLDFQTLTQTNVTTEHQRKIRRILEH